MDLWLFIHLLSGLTLGSLCYILDFSYGLALGIGIGLICGWELFEWLFDIKEHNENKLIDIIIGLLGFWVGYRYMSSNLDHVYLLFIIEICLLGILCIIGWLNYKRYGRGI